MTLFSFLVLCVLCGRFLIIPTTGKVRSQGSYGTASSLALVVYRNSPGDSRIDLFLLVAPQIIRAGASVCRKAVGTASMELFVFLAC